MKVLYASAVALGLLTVPAWAWDCPARQRIYESAESAAETIRFAGANLVLAKNGQEQVYQTSGDAGSPVKAARLASETDAPKVTFMMVDVSRVAAADKPDQVLIFDNRVFWPTCKR